MKLVKLNTLAEYAFEFAYALEKQCARDESLLTSFRAAASDQEKLEWRNLVVQAKELQPHADGFTIEAAINFKEDGANVFGDYRDHVHLSIAEIFARVGIRAFGEETTKNFLPPAARGEETAFSFKMAGAPNMEKLCR